MISVIFTASLMPVFYANSPVRVGTRKQAQRPFPYMGKLSSQSSVWCSFWRKKLPHILLNHFDVKPTPKQPRAGRFPPSESYRFLHHIIVKSSIISLALKRVIGAFGTLKLAKFRRLARITDGF